MLTITPESFMLAEIPLKRWCYENRIDYADAFEMRVLIEQETIVVRTSCYRVNEHDARGGYLIDDNYNVVVAPDRYYAAASLPPSGYIIEGTDRWVS